MFLTCTVVSSPIATSERMENFYLSLIKDYHFLTQIKLLADKFIQLVINVIISMKARAHQVFSTKFSYFFIKAQLSFWGQTIWDHKFGQVIWRWSP